MIQQQFRSAFQTSQHNTSNRLMRFVTIGLTAGLIASFLNSLILFAAQSLNGGSLLVGGSAISLLAILGFSFFPSIFAALLYAVLERFSRFHRAIFLGVALMVFMGFFFGPLNAASNSLTLWSLETMHLVAATPIVALLLRAKSNNKAL